MADPPVEHMIVGGHDIALSNPDKVLFPQHSLTKRDLVEYYRRVADVALPYYRDRPLTMQRFPDGIAKEGFFQKQSPAYFPIWIERIELAKEGGTVHHVIANDVATLVYLAEQGCVTPHLSLARRDKPHHPDRLVLDLDPSDDDFGKVQQAARMLKALLDELELESYVQTTGSRGLHVILPLDRSANFEEARGFARKLAERLIDQNPDALTIEQRKRKRGNRVFLDYLRNAYGQTAVAPYAVRAIEGAPVATPLRWDEASGSNLGPQKYTIENIFRRLSQIDDPWAGMERRAYPLAAAWNRLAQLA